MKNVINAVKVDKIKVATELVNIMLTKYHDEIADILKDDGNYDDVTSFLYSYLAPVEGTIFDVIEKVYNAENPELVEEIRDIWWNDEDAYYSFANKIWEEFEVLFYDAFHAKYNC